MKKILSLITATGLLASCDYVKFPKEKSQLAAGNRKVLVEDFTGHKCDNCPSAAKVLFDLVKNTYHENVIVLAVHAGGFTDVDEKHLDLDGDGQDELYPFPTNFTTPEGNTYFSDMSIGSNPSFTISRKQAGLGQYKYTSVDLAAEIATELEQPAPVSIDITSQYNATDRSVTGKVAVKALEDFTGSYKLVIALSEDSIISPQLDKDSPIYYIPNYVHMHVFRGNVNGVWGETFMPPTGLYKDDVADKTFSYTLPSHLDPKHVHLVAYVYNEKQGNEYLEIIQAEEKKLVE